MAKLATKLAKLPGTEPQGEWDHQGAAGADTSPQETETAAAGLAARYA